MGENAISGPKSPKLQPIYRVHAYLSALLGENAISIWICQIIAAICRKCNIDAISELYRGYLKHWISLRPTGYRTARFRRQDLSLLNAQFQVCQDMRFRSSHGDEMKIKHDR